MCVRADFAHEYSFCGIKKMPISTIVDIRLSNLTKIGQHLARSTSSAAPRTSAAAAVAVSVAGTVASACFRAPPVGPAGNRHGFVDLLVSVRFATNYQKIITKLLVEVKAFVKLYTVYLKVYLLSTIYNPVRVS